MSASLLKNRRPGQRKNHRQDADATSTNRLWLATCPRAFVFLPASILFFNCAALLCDVFGQVNPAPLSLPIEVAQDSIKFVNGDHISGSVTNISNGELSFTFDLTGQTLSFPIENLSELTFAGPPQPPPEIRDVIYLRDGSYLSATVTALEQNAVEAITSSGQQLAIPKEHIAAVGFHHPNDVVFQSDFSSKAQMRLTPVLGSWDVEKGQLVQASSTAFCRAYVAIAQSGVMRYEWAMELQGTATGGLCFFASNPEARFGESSYMVIARGRQLYFNKVMGEARHQGQRKDIPQTESFVRFLVEYDPRSGETLICTDGKPLVRFRDLNPLRNGGYVLLHTEGRAVFDDLKITYVVGGIEETLSNPSVDTVLLSNGDKVSGHVTSISDTLTLRSSYASGETPIPRNSVRSIAFAYCGAGPGRRTAASSELSFWNGDRIFGEITALDELAGIVEMSHGAKVSVLRASLRTIRFWREDFPVGGPEQPRGDLSLIDLNLAADGCDIDLEMITIDPR